MYLSFLLWHRYPNVVIVLRLFSIPTVAQCILLYRLLNLQIWGHGHYTSQICLFWNNLSLKGRHFVPWKRRRPIGHSTDSRYISQLGLHMTCHLHTHTHTQPAIPPNYPTPLGVSQNADISVVLVKDLFHVSIQSNFIEHLPNFLCHGSLFTFGWSVCHTYCVVLYFS